MDQRFSLITFAYVLSSFKAEVKVPTSQLFYSWVSGFRGQVKIKAPENVKHVYEEMVKDAFYALNA